MLTVEVTAELWQNIMLIYYQKKHIIFDTTILQDENIDSGRFCKTC